ncbi:MAG: acyltransferase family protein [Candidatus Geothermincolia bacterium]
MGERRYELDWLRVIAILLLIYYHSARVFDEGSFYVKNQSLSGVWQAIVSLVGIWAMPLLFFIAGASVFFALRKRSSRQFASERSKRLAIPFLFGMIFIAAPQIYVVFIQKAGNPTSYIAFWKYQFSVPPLTTITAGRVGPAYIQAATWEPAHLWFIIYLFIFCIVTLPLLSSLRSGRLHGANDRFAGYCQRHRSGIFLFALPFMLAYISAFVMSENLSRFFLVVPFLYGFIVYSDPRFGEAVDRNYKLAFWIALVTTTAFALVVGIGGYDLAAGGAGAFLWGPWLGLEAWLWILAIIGLGRRRLNRGNAFLDYASEGSYPFYILHQTVLVFLAYGIVQIAMPSIAKYLLLSTAALVINVAIYDLIIRRWAPTRFLFGMHPRKKTAPVPEGIAEPAVALEKDVGEIDGDA